MASIDLNISCGCGYRANSLEAAVGHSDTTHHTIQILGVIKPTVSKAAIEAASKAANSTVSKASPVRPQRPEEPVDDSVSAIRALRTKFSKR